MIVQLTVKELEQLIRSVVRDELEVNAVRKKNVEPMTVPETARKLHCSERTVRRLLAERSLTGSRVGKRVMISVASVDNFLEQSTRPARSR